MSRRNFNSEFKVKVVLEALKEMNTLGELAKKYKLYPQQITNWKKEFKSKAPIIFSKGGGLGKSEEEQEREKLLRIIGELKVENDFLKKRSQ